MHSTIFIILTGATATGKSTLVNSLIAKYGNNLTVINADCKQVYNEIPIVTAQPAKEVREKMHLYGHLSVINEYNVFCWLSDITKVIYKTNFSKKKEVGNIVIFVGGSTMYLECLSEGISHIPQCKQSTLYSLISEAQNSDLIAFKKKYSELYPDLREILLRNYTISSFIKETAYLIDFNVTRSTMMLKYPREKVIEAKFHYFVLDKNRQALYEDINKRVVDMVNNNVLDEINEIKDKNLSTNAYTTHGVIEFIEYIKGQITLEEAISITQQKTRNYAKRQMTWIRNKIKTKTYIKNSIDLEYQIDKLCRQYNT